MTFCEELFLPLSVSTSLLAGESGTSAVAAELIERSSASFQEGSMKIVNFDVLVFIFRQGEDIRLRRYININIYIYKDMGFESSWLNLRDPSFLHLRIF